MLVYIMLEVLVEVLGLLKKIKKNVVSVDQQLD